MTDRIDDAVNNSEPLTSETKGARMESVIAELRAIRQILDSMLQRSKKDRRESKELDKLGD